MIAWIFICPALAVCALVVVNVITWRRPRAQRPASTRSAILIPARNEASRIDATLRAARETSAAEIWVCDDRSTDDTAAIVRVYAKMDPRVHLLAGRPMPRGWVGKVHACAQLADASSAERMIFLDADVEVDAALVERLASTFGKSDADVVSAVPRQRTGSFVEGLVIPLLHLTYLSWLWLPLVERTRDPRFVAANGQILAIERHAYEILGGWSAVKGAIVDDVALCRAAKSAGLRVSFVDGDALGSCRMYTGAREVFDGFTKNLYAGIGATRLRLVLVVALYALVYLAPFALLPLEPVAALVGISANLVCRAVVVVRYRAPLWTLALHPLSIVILFWIAARSARAFETQSLTWRGRVYSEVTT